MSQIHIETESFGDDILTPLRRVEVGEVTVDTPTVAIDIKKTREHESVQEAARGVNELYRTVDGETLARARRGENTITKDLKRGYNKTKEDELTIVFISYEEATTLSEGDAQYLCDVIASFSDVMTVPLMPGLARVVETERGTADPAFRSYLESVETFLEVAARRAPEMSIMGMIPMLGHEYVTKLMDMYGREQIRSFCLNFDRTKITASTKVDMVRPIMSSIARRGIEERVLFYGINLAPGSRDENLGVRPAADFAGIGMGLDIIGGNHVSPKLPQSVFEDTEGKSGEETTFRLFDKEEWIYREVPLKQLPEEFPEDSTLEAEHVMKRCLRSPRNTVNRLQKIVNAEQKALATNRIHPEIEDGDVVDHVATKTGVTVSTTESFQLIREDFDADREQSGLDDF